MTRWTLRALRCTDTDRETVLECGLDDVDELLAIVRRSYGRPEATFWTGSAPESLTPVGWITAAPGASRHQQDSVLGRVVLPGDYLEITVTDSDGVNLLERWDSDPDTRATLARHGLLPELDTARPVIETLHARLGATLGSSGPRVGAVRRALDHGVTARRLGAMHLAAEAWCRAGSVMHEVGEHELALRLHRWGLSALMSSGGTPELARCRSDIGHALWHTGKPAEALAEFERARQLFEDAGQQDGTELRHMLVRLSAPLADTGRTDEALALLPTMEAGMTDDPAAGALDARYAHARAYVLRAAGRCNEALTHGEKALALTLDHGSLSAAAEVHGLLAGLFAEAGDFVAATNHRTAVNDVQLELRRTVGV